ncbi:hypothetical protein [Georgenia thermotolerans]|uniref:Uncharacterized protein n=1 Tax=Georgenia thermotolerans TaxID=527326 RepID=A0A7J5UUR8_9MICO|nr:hypothetical protein [Georgenia thermotolerans]KAE8766010.1 hypothetical protein GB883_00955 [Georgenia thermotolerans]
MNTYVIPVTFPDLDTAKRDASLLVDALRTAGLHAEMADDPRMESEDDADRIDPGPTTRELHVHAGSVGEVRERVQTVVDGRFPPGMVLLGEPTPL